MRRAISHIGMYLILLGAFGLVAALLFSVCPSPLIATVGLASVALLAIACKVKFKIHFL